MGLFINTNIASVNAQRHLNRSSKGLNQSFERLASGLRVNHAADDAAGLAISERLTTQVRGLNQSVRNANDAISLVQVTESALQESTAILQRIRELSVQAASDANTESDRAALQEEVAQLQDELNRIGATTTFNGQKLLDGSFTDKFFHIGSNFRETVRVQVRDARPQTLGRWAVQTGTTVTTNAIAGDNLLINGITVRPTQPADDLLSTSFATGSAIAKAAAINDSTAFHGVTAYTNTTERDGVAAIAGGTLDNTNYIEINGRIITGVNVGVDDPLERLARAINAEFEETGVIAGRNRDGQLTLTAQDGRNIEVVVTGTAGVTTGLANSVTTGSLTMHSKNQYRLSGSQEDYVGFENDALVGVSSIQAVETMNVTTRENANLGLLIIDRAIQQLAADRAELGAIQNRLESTINNLSAISEIANTARSRIMDADFAVETANLSRSQILQQAGTSILAQANQAPQQALSLLQ